VIADNSDVWPDFTETK